MSRFLTPLLRFRLRMLRFFVGAAASHSSLAGPISGIATQFVGYEPSAAGPSPGGLQS